MGSLFLPRYAPFGGVATVRRQGVLVDTRGRLAGHSGGRSAGRSRRTAAVVAPRARAWVPRLWGGAVGYFAYDVVRFIERLPRAPADDLGLPDGLFLFTDVVLAIDNLRGRAMAIAAVPTDVGMDDADLRSAYDGAADRTAALITRLQEEAAPAPLELKPEPRSDPTFTSSSTREQFEEGVERIRAYIRAGDAFQVVLSQRLGMELRASPFDLYRALRSLNPSPYLYFLELDGLTLVGSSPEVLVRLEDGVVTVRPIAGTRRRGAHNKEDRALATDLLRDEKELAEHRMLVDLGRNDVGRVAEHGSVRVPELMVVERYSHVMHIVSQVEGRLRQGCLRSMHSGPASLQARFPEHPRFARWRSLTSWSRSSGARTRERWATSAGAA